MSGNPPLTYEDEVPESHQKLPKEIKEERLHDPDHIIGVQCIHRTPLLLLHLCTEPVGAGSVCGTLSSQYNKAAFLHP